MVRKRSDSSPKCIETIRDSKVKVVDPGTARSGILSNQERVRIRRIRVDDCLAPKGSMAADWVVSKPDVVDVIVELKGKNVDHAVDQIEATLTFWSAHDEHANGQVIGAWIVCTEYPRASTKVARYRERLRSRGTILLFSTRSGEEKSFSAFVPKKS
jgi:hypothetical protein